MELFLKSVDNSNIYIDLDIDNNPNFLNSEIDYLRKKQAKIILSYHNFIETPSLEDLLKILNFCNQFSPEIIKIACKSNNKIDCANILSLYSVTYQHLLNKHSKLITIGMGEIGKITRISSLYLGAPFTYLSWKKGLETAEGQFDTDTMLQIMELIQNV